MTDRASQALREQSAEVLTQGLVAQLREGKQAYLTDWRDLLVALAPYHDAARRLGLDVVTVFDRVADEGPGEFRDRVREFGRRRDVTPAAFGFVLEDTVDGPHYRYDLGS